MTLRRFTREEFIGRYWQYAPGEHVTIIAPTGWGKTYWTNELLTATARPELPAVVFSTKPRDSTVDKLKRETRWPVVRDWPPAMHRRYLKPGGYILWPKHTYDPAIDEWRHGAIFRRGILDPYKRGRHIIVADELYALTNEYVVKGPDNRPTRGLARELATVWTRGRSMGTGLWGGSQRPAHIPLHAYSQPVHLFLGNDPDRRGRQRFKEIGGVDPDLLERETAELQPREWLYVNRTQRAACIIGAR